MASGKKIGVEQTVQTSETTEAKLALGLHHPRRPRSPTCIRLSYTTLLFSLQSLDRSQASGSLPHTHFLSVATRTKRGEGGEKCMRVQPARCRNHEFLLHWHIFLFVIAKQSILTRICKNVRLDRYYVLLVALSNHDRNRTTRWDEGGHVTRLESAIDFHRIPNSRKKSAQVYACLITKEHKT